MRGITTSNTHQNEAKEGGVYGPHGPKFWWVVVECETRTKERSEAWVDGVSDKNKKTTKTKKKPDFCFLPFFCKNGLGLDRPRRLLVKHQGLAFGPQIEADSLSLMIMGSDRSI